MPLYVVQADDKLVRDGRPLRKGDIIEWPAAAAADAGPSVVLPVAPSVTATPAPAPAEATATAPKKAKGGPV